MFIYSFVVVIIKKKHNSFNPRERASEAAPYVHSFTSAADDNLLFKKLNADDAMKRR